MTIDAVRRGYVTSKSPLAPSASAARRMVESRARRRSDPGCRALHGLGPADRRRSSRRWRRSHRSAPLCPHLGWVRIRPQRDTGVRSARRVTGRTAHGPRDRMLLSMSSFGSSGRQRVSCELSNVVYGYPAEDLASVLIRFESGAHASVRTTFNCGRNDLMMEPQRSPREPRWLGRDCPGTSRGIPPVAVSVLSGDGQPADRKIDPARADERVRSSGRQRLDRDNARHAIERIR